MDITFNKKGESLYDVNLENLDYKYLNETGDKMRGNLDMNGKKLLNVPLPVEDSDVVNKKYVDDLEIRMIQQIGKISYINSEKISDMLIPLSTKIKTLEEKIDKLEKNNKQHECNLIKQHEELRTKNVYLSIFPEQYKHIMFGRYNIDTTFVYGNKIFFPRIIGKEQTFIAFPLPATCTMFIVFEIMNHIDGINIDKPTNILIPLFWLHHHYSTRQKYRRVDVVNAVMCMHFKINCMAHSNHEKQFKFCYYATNYHSKCPSY